MKTYGVILAAGSSTRFNSKVNKLFYKVNGKEIIVYPVETFLNNEDIAEVLIVSSESNISKLENLFIKHQNVSIILGGASRQESEYRALQYLHNRVSEKCFIAIHDAARSFISTELLANLINTAKKYGSAAPYIEKSKFYNIINKEVVRNKKIVEIQTPQIYKFKDLYNCYTFLSNNKILGMVDTTESMYNFNKFETCVIKGEDRNIKITYKSDLDYIKKENF